MNTKKNSDKTRLEGNYIPDYKNLKKTIKDLKNEGRKIVLTQGVWDMLHRGHINYLREAKKHGDVLVVGVDSDELTKKRKGPNRPFDDEKSRIETISSLRFVDIVTLRHPRHNIGELIRTIKPDVLVASKTTKDFTAKDAVLNRKFCGKVKVLPPQADTSTTAKLRNLMLNGAHGLRGAIDKAVESYIESLKP